MPAVDADVVEAVLDGGDEVRDVEDWVREFLRPWPVFPGMQGTTACHSARRRATAL